MEKHFCVRHFCLNFRFDNAKIFLQPLPIAKCWIAFRESFGNTVIGLQFLSPSLTCEIMVGWVGIKTCGVIYEVRWLYSVKQPLGFHKVFRVLILLPLQCCLGQLQCGMEWPADVDNLAYEVGLAKFKDFLGNTNMEFLKSAVVEWVKTFSAANTNCDKKTLQTDGQR